MAGCREQPAAHTSKNSAAQFPFFLPIILNQSGPTPVTTQVASKIPIRAQLESMSYKGAFCGGRHLFPAPLNWPLPFLRLKTIARFTGPALTPIPARA